MLTDLELDQAALRALLGQLWDVDSEVRLVTTIDDEITGSTDDVLALARSSERACCPSP